MMKKITISFLSILLVTYLSAQKNNIYGSLGLLHSSINYERTILEPKKKAPEFLVTIFAGKGEKFFFCFQCSVSDYYKFSHLGAMLTMIFGEGNNHFEMGLGGGPVWAETNTDMNTRRLYPRINLGYRFEIDSIFFRAGTGYPEIRYLSFGVRF